MNTLSITYCKIPGWLREGDFFRNLNAEDPDDIINIPADCFVEDNHLTVENTLVEFCRMIRATLFWILDEIPVGVLEYCILVDDVAWQDAIRSVPGAAESKIFEPLCGVYPFVGKVTFQSILMANKWELIIHAAQFTKYIDVATSAAAEMGNLSALQYFHEQGLPWDEYTCWRASANDHLDCLQYAHENGCLWNADVYVGAASRGHLRIMQYACAQGLTEWHNYVCKFAATNGHLACLQFAHENGSPWDKAAVRGAAQFGHLHCLQYLLEQGCPIHNEACNVACQNGHLSCLELLHAHNAPWDANTSHHAAICPDIACLQYLHVHGCPWDEETPLKAAQAGHVTMLRYSMHHDCPYNDSLMSAAVKNNNIECLQYLVEDQLLWMSEAALASAFRVGSFACLQYLIDQGCPPHLNSEFADTQFEELGYYQIFMNDDPPLMECVRYAGDRGLTVNAAFCEYVSCRDNECLDYLWSQGLHQEEKRGVRKKEIIVVESKNEKKIEEIDVPTVSECQLLVPYESAQSIKIEYVHIMLTCSALMLVGWHYSYRC